MKNRDWSIQPWLCTWAAAIPAAITAVGTGISLAGTLSAAGGQRAAGAEAAQADILNAQIQRRNAAVAMAQAQSQAAIDYQKTEMGLGGVQAAYGASGVSATQGSPLDVMRAVASAGEVERQLDIYRGTVQATGALSQAQIDQLEAQRARQAGDIAARGTLLTGVGSAVRGAMPLVNLIPGAANTVPASGGGADYVNPFVPRY